MPNNGYTPTDIDLDTVLMFDHQGKSFVDIRRLMVEFNIYEDLYTPTIKADITLLDAIGLIERFPITGDETVHIKFKTPADPNAYKKLIFSIYKLDSRGKYETRSDTYVLHLVSSEMITASSASLDTAYNAQPISDMVAGIYETVLKPSLDRFKIVKTDKTMTIEPTQGSHSIIAPMCNPFKFIRYLASRAKSSSHPASNFVFFENIKGFSFVTIDSLMSADTVGQYYYGEFNLPEYDKHGDNPVREYQKIMGLDYINQFDVLKNYYNGLYNNEVAVLDPIRKKFVTNSFRYETDFDQIDHIGTKKITPPGSTHDGGSRSHQRMIIEPISDSNFHRLPYFADKVINGATIADQQLAYPSRRQTFLPQQTAAAAQLNNIVINITIPGDANLMVGQTVDVLIPQTSSDDELKNRNNILFGKDNDSAKFLVTAVNHNYKLSDDDFVTHLQCVKDSYERDLVREATLIDVNDPGDDF